MGHHAMVCWLVEEQAPAGICQKDYASKKCHFPIHPEKQGGRDEDWHDCSVHAGERFCCHV